jgi:hypothetical protein
MYDGSWNWNRYTEPVSAEAEEGYLVALASGRNYKSPLFGEGFLVNF